MIGDTDLDPREVDNRLREIERDLVNLDSDEKKLLRLKGDLEIKQRQNRGAIEKLEQEKEELQVEDKKMEQRLFEIQEERKRLKKKLDKTQVIKSNLQYKK